MSWIARDCTCYVKVRYNLKMELTDGMLRDGGMC